MLKSIMDYVKTLVGAFIQGWEDGMREDAARRTALQAGEQLAAYSLTPEELKRLIEQAMRTRAAGMLN